MIAKMKRHFTVVLAAAALVSGCSEATQTAPQGDNLGKAAFACDVSASVGVTRAETKLLPADHVPAVEALKLEITGNEGVIASYEAMADYDQPLLKEGSYTARFSYGDSEEEGAGKACFKGEKNFKIVARKTITEEVTVNLVNSIVTLHFSEWFRKYYTEYSINLRTESGFHAGFIGSATTPLIETVPIYVKPDTKLFFGGTATKTNGVQVSFPETEIGVAAVSTWHTVNINAGQVGQAGIVVSLDDTPTAIEEIPVELNPDA